MSGFTHFNEDGNAVMVDVGEKAETKREEAGASDTASALLQSIFSGGRD